MGQFFESNKTIKWWQYEMQQDPAKEQGPVKMPYSPIVKWYNTTWTFEQKYKCGRMTYDEYLLWMEELKKEEEEKNGTSGSVQTGSTAGTTFWQQDGGARENLSTDAYADFLAQNSIDVSTNATVDIASLLAEAEGTAEPAPEPVKDEAQNDGCPPQSSNDNNSLIGNDVDVDEVLKSVNSSIHGDDYLTQEEIAALFAAANAGASIG